ncbi:MAG: MMPL family transporter, partial [Planctomycetota bacterium]
EEGLDIVGDATSIATFLPDPAPPSRSSVDPNSTARYMMRQQLDDPAKRAEMYNSEYLRHEEFGPSTGADLFRISLRVGALTDVDYSIFVEQIPTAVEPIAQGYESVANMYARLDQRPGGIPKRPRVMLIMNDAPRPLSRTTVLHPIDENADTPQTLEDRINSNAIHVATIGELLGSKGVKFNIQVLSKMESPIDMTSDSWRQQLQQTDAIVLAGENEWMNQDALQSAISSSNQDIVLVDARQARTTPPPRTYAVDSATLPPGETSTTPPSPMIRGDGPIQVVYTGVVPVVYKAQGTLLTSLIESIGWAFVLIAGVMAVLLNPGRTPTSIVRGAPTGILAGLIAMIPNVFPIAIVFGIMGHLSNWNVKVDIGTMMTASVAMGVAVDDTIHFLSWFRKYLDAGMDRTAAVIETYKRVGPAMTQTTLVGGLGLFVFALSTFTPTQRFGTLMLILLGTALVGDLVFLPAILVGPLGRFFRSDKAMAAQAARRARLERIAAREQALASASDHDAAGESTTNESEGTDSAASSSQHSEPVAGERTRGTSQDPQTESDVSSKRRRTDSAHRR